MRALFEHEADVHREALEALVHGPLLSAERMSGAEGRRFLREAGCPVAVQLAQPGDLEHARVIELAGYLS